MLNALAWVAPSRCHLVRPWEVRNAFREIAAGRRPSRHPGKRGRDSGTYSRGDAVVQWGRGVLHSRRTILFSIKYCILTSFPESMIRQKTFACLWGELADTPTRMLKLHTLI